MYPPPHPIRIVSCFSLLQRPSSAPLLPYTTLFRSRQRRPRPQVAQVVAADVPRRGERLAGQGAQPRRGHRRLQPRSEEHTSELQSLTNLVCRLLLEKKKNATVTVWKKGERVGNAWI